MLLSCFCQSCTLQATVTVLIAVRSWLDWGHSVCLVSFSVVGQLSKHASFKVSGLLLYAGMQA